MSELFQMRENEGASGVSFHQPAVKTVFKGELSLRSFGPKVWNQMLPAQLKNLEFFGEFKEKIKSWVPICNCRNCREYIQGVGFVS